MSQGPLPTDFATSLVNNAGVFGMELRRRMALYNHMAGLKIVGEVMPDAANRVELSDEKDALGLPIPRITFRFGENDRKLPSTRSVSCVGRSRRPGRATSSKRAGRRT